MFFSHERCLLILVWVGILYQFADLVVRVLQIRISQARFFNFYKSSPVQSARKIQYALWLYTQLPEKKTYTFSYTRVLHFLWTVLMPVGFDFIFHLSSLILDVFTLRHFLFFFLLLLLLLLLKHWYSYEFSLRKGSWFWFLSFRVTWHSHDDRDRESCHAG